MGNMRFKVGDRVRIKSIDWYNENKDADGIVELSTHVFVPGMSQFCGKVVTIEDVFEDIDDNVVYYMEGIDYDWTDEMIEGLVENDNPFDDDMIPLPDSFVERMAEKIATSELFNVEPLDIPTMTTDFVKENGLPCPNGYQFVDENGNVINATKIVLEKKTKEFPKTYEECCNILHAKRYHGSLLETLQRLLVCRDAYWKIAGEEMGLGKPWEPDYDSGVDKFGIVYFDNTIMKTCAIARWERHLNKILEFPTEEMRDDFYENFKELIEQCRELL